MKRFLELSYGECFAIGLVLAGMYWFFLFDSGSEKKAFIAVQQGEYKKLVSQIEKFELNLKSAGRYKAMVEEFSSVIDKLQKYFVKGSEVESVVRTVGDAARDSGLSINNLQIGRERVVEGKPYIKIPVNLQFSGTFVESMKFLSRLTSVDKIFTVDTFAINLLGNQKDRSEKVSVNMSILGYRYISEEDNNGEKGK